MRDQGRPWVGSFVKWDDQPSSPEVLWNHGASQSHNALRHPTAPVYICLDAGCRKPSSE